jgi:hypothetical protein
MKLKSLIILIAAIIAVSVFAHAEEEQDNSHARVVIYPILFQAPIYGVNIRLPEFDGAGAISRSTDRNLDSAFLAGVSIERDKWFFDFEGEYAGLSAERVSPILKVSTDLFFFKAMGGWRFGKGFAIDGGVKRLAVDLKVELGDNLEAHTKPGLWDPMVGIDWRSFVTKRLQLNAALEGGGFGVGSDVDISGRFDADWELIPHVVFNFGYSFLYFKATVDNVTVGPNQRELTMKQTLHGPRVGIGIRF